MIKAGFGLVVLCISIQAYSQPDNWKGRIELRAGVECLLNPAEGLWDQYDTKKISISKVLSIGEAYSDRQELFSWVKDIITDSDGNIYGCDSKLSRVQVFNRQGTYIRTIGRTGKGPGDLLRPIAMAIDQNAFLYVLDDLNNRISVFNAGGFFHRVIKFKYYGFAHESLAINEKGNVLLSHILYNSDNKKSLPLLTEYNPDGKVISEYGVQKILLKNDGNRRPVPESYSFCAGIDGKILVGTSNPYVIQVYIKGSLSRIIQRDSPVFTKTELAKVNYRPLDGPAAEVLTIIHRSSIWRILPLPDGRFITFIRDAGRNYKENSNEREFTTSIDLFDQNGYFLKSYPWDWQKLGLLLHVDQEGYFYSNIGENPDIPGITKWKVTLE